MLSVKDELLSKNSFKLSLLLELLSSVEVLLSVVEELSVVDVLLSSVDVLLSSVFVSVDVSVEVSVVGGLQIFNYSSGIVTLNYAQ